jgi:uncharacterized protein YaiI (UPF0178 family)
VFPVKILVDADSCPVQARRVILKAAEKRCIQAIFAANRQIPGIEGDFAVMALCSEYVDAADDYIVELAEDGDIAVTRDVPLAARLVDKDIAVLDDRGRIFTRDNIGNFMSIRDFNIELTMSGAGMERIANYGKKEIKTFADSFDKLLTKLCTPDAQA